MFTNNNNKNDESGIDKFDGSFEKEDSGCTIVINETINSITNIAALGLYVYLICRPSNWKLNIKHLSKHFDCNKDKIYSLIDFLRSVNLLTRTEIRNKGKFVRFHYRVHLRPHMSTKIALNLSQNKRIDFSVDFEIDQEETLAGIGLLPVLEKPDTVKPDMVFPDAYKTKNIINKDTNKNPSVDLQSTGYKKDELFMRFYSAYPNKQKPELARKSFYKHKPNAEFVQMLIDDIKKRCDNNWKNRHTSKIPHPSTYLNTKEWEGDIYPADSNVTQLPVKPPRFTMDELLNGAL